MTDQLTAVQRLGLSHASAQTFCILQVSSAVPAQQVSP